MNVADVGLQHIVGVRKALLTCNEEVTRIKVHLKVRRIHKLNQIQRTIRRASHIGSNLIILCFNDDRHIVLFGGFYYRLHVTPITLHGGFGIVGKIATVITNDVRST